MRSFATENYSGADIKSGVHKCAPLLCRKTRFASGFLHDEVFAACYGNVSFSKIAALNGRITAAVGGGAVIALGRVEMQEFTAVNKYRARRALRLGGVRHVVKTVVSRV